MNKRLIKFVCAMWVLALVSIGCTINKEETIYKNTVFTKELLGQMKEIDFGLENEMAKIQDSKRMKQFYGQLASLTLTEVDEDTQPLYGHLMVELITNDKKISVGILAEELSINEKRYKADKDIIEKLRKIADSE